MNLADYPDTYILLCEEERPTITVRTLLNYSQGSLTVTQEVCIDGLVIAEDNILLSQEQMYTFASYLNDTIAEETSKTTHAVEITTTA
jgi:hypothetical protein